MNDHKNCDCKEILEPTNIMMPNKCHIIHEDDIDLFNHYKAYTEKFNNIKSEIKITIKCIDEYEELVGTLPKWIRIKLKEML